MVGQMKSFEEFCATDDILEEGIIRTGAIVSYGSQSRKHGEDAVRAFRSGQQELRKAMSDDSVEERLERIEKSLDSLFDGLMAQRKQIGAGVAVDVAGHMLAAKARKQR